MNIADLHRGPRSRWPTDFDSIFPADCSIAACYALFALLLSSKISLWRRNLQARAILMFFYTCSESFAHCQRGLMNTCACANGGRGNPKYRVSQQSLLNSLHRHRGMASHGIEEEELWLFRGRMICSTHVPSATVNGHAQKSVMRKALHMAASVLNVALLFELSKARPITKSCEMSTSRPLTRSRVKNVGLLNFV